MKRRKIATDPNNPPTFVWTLKELYISEPETRFTNWWNQWSLALITRMTDGGNNGTLPMNNLNDLMWMRWETMIFCEYVTSKCASYWFEWTFDRACEVTQCTFVRWRLHAFWVLRKSGLPKDVCRLIVSLYPFWSLDDATKRGAKMMEILFKWENAGAGEEKKLKWLNV